MTNHQNSLVAEQQEHTGKGPFWAGVILLVSTLLVLFLMLHHPSASSHQFSDMVDEFGAHNHGTNGLPINAIVHGGAIFFMGLYLFGFSWLSTCLGWNRSSVRIAMIAYTIGALAMIAAALVNGFIVPLFLSRYVDASPREIEHAVHLLGMFREVNHACDQLGVVAMSIGVFFWSLAMVTRPKKIWLVGLLGIVAGLIGATGPITGHFEATVHGIILFVAVQGVWNVGAAVTMMRWPAHALLTKQ